MNGTYEKHFKRWLVLREEHRKAKRDKEYREIIRVGAEILELSRQCPTIGIVSALFLCDTADAYTKLDDIPNAIAQYKMAVASLENYRRTAKLRDPDDFLADLERWRKKLIALERKNKPRN
jgi:hypothetical protein